MEALSWRVAREQLLAELQAQAEGNVQTAHGEGLRTSQLGANGQASASPATNPRRGPKESTSGYAAAAGSATGSSPRARGGALPLSVAVAQRQYDQLLSQMPAITSAIVSPGRPGSGGNVPEGTRQPAPTQLRSATGVIAMPPQQQQQAMPGTGEGLAMGPGVNQPYRHGPRSSGPGAAENRLVAGGGHIVSTRHRPTRPSPIVDAAAATGSTPYGRGSGGTAATAGAEPALPNGASELPLLPQVQQTPPQQHQYRVSGTGGGGGSGGGGGGGGGGASPMPRQQKRVSQSNAMGSAGTE
ncbi:hypothetical protein Vretifemale_7625, partial [Volvox reticuliferus]